MVALENPPNSDTINLSEGGGSQKLQALYRFSNRLFRAATPADIYEVALDALEEALGCVRASILVFDEGGVMRFAAWRGLSSAYRRAVDGHSPWTPGQREAEPLLIEDIEHADQPSELKTAIQSEGIQALAFIPLTIAGGVIGKFMVYFDEPHHFSPGELELATTIGGHLSFSLERMRSEQALNRERELLQTVIDRIPVMITVYEPGRALLRLNAEFESVLGWSTQEAFGVPLLEQLLPEPELRNEVRAFMRDCPDEWSDVPMRARDGRTVETSWANIRLQDNTQVGIGLDMTRRKRGEEALRRYAEQMRVLNRVMRTLSRDLDRTRIVQEATDSASELTGAGFSAFLSHEVEAGLSSYALYALSGAPAEAFTRLDETGAADFLSEIFRSDEILRIDDARLDLGDRASLFGAVSDAPLLSYLAAPVVSRTGEILGALCLGHQQAGFFTPEDELVVSGIAAQAAIAMDNASLLRAKEEEIAQRRSAEFAAQRLAAIVESSEDAILAKDLYGIITNWNAGAERLLGYSADEVIGKSMMMLVPADRCEEEGRILAKIRMGERVLPFETVRIGKSGDELHVLLSVSPLRDPDGKLVGASTIAHDITERRRAEQRQQLLLREMDHRIKNLFTLAGGLVTLSARGARDPKELADTVRERLGALARAHALTLSGGDRSTTTLHALMKTIVSPYDDGSGRISVEGDDQDLGGDAVTGLALLLHEFTTNAAKYGALSTDKGRLAITCARLPQGLAVTWRETGGPPTPSEVAEGFGSRLIKATAASQLDGEIIREWRPEGLTIHFTTTSSGRGSPDDGPTGP